MNESDWDNCADPQAMLDWLREQRKLSERKARLFSVACCRRIWSLLTDERNRRAVEFAERYVDSPAPPAELEAVRDSSNYVALTISGLAATHAASAATLCLHPDSLRAARETWSEALYAVHPAWSTEFAAGAELLRDICCNRLRRVAHNISLLTPAILPLATAAYEERQLPSGHLDPARLAVLADALEEASCSYAELLSHLRSPGPHVRGCFALDAVLGKR